MKIFQKKERHINFMKQRLFGFVLSAILLTVSVVSLATRGLNYGIDFEGGILLEATAEQAIDLATVRKNLSFLHSPTIQTAGTEGKTILIQAQIKEGENATQAVNRVKETLGSGYTYSQVEVVGPTIGQELKEKSRKESVGLDLSPIGHCCLYLVPV